MLTVLEVIKKSSEFLGTKGIDSARLNAELLVGHALGLRRMQLYLQFERVLTEPELEAIRELMRRRGKQEPLQYIVGSLEFHGLKLKVDKRALIPRPETEWIVDSVVKRWAQSPPSSVLDLGTGTGAIALALAKAWPNAEVTAVDKSASALALAQENAASTELANRIRFVQSDWFSSIPEGARFGLIISNPPYLSAEETAAAKPEVRNYEPLQALTADNNGLSDLKKILEAAPRYVEPGGCLALETGPTQHPALRDYASEFGWKRTESLADLTGRDRCFLAFRA